jgi:hypothetical protein
MPRNSPFLLLPWPMCSTPELDCGRELDDAGRASVKSGVPGPRS